MTLSEYIKLHGDEICAIAWGVKPRTTASWRRGERLPRPDQAHRIVKETCGAVSYAGIYGQDSKEAA